MSYIFLKVEELTGVIMKRPDKVISRGRGQKNYLIRTMKDFLCVTLYFYSKLLNHHVRLLVCHNFMRMKGIYTSNDPMRFLRTKFVVSSNMQ